MWTTWSQDSYIHRYAQAVSFIFLALAFEFGGEIYIGDEPGFLESHLELRANQNISGLPPEEIEGLITDVIVQMRGSVHGLDCLSCYFSRSINTDGVSHEWSI